MNDQNKEFYSLLETILLEQTFMLELCPELSGEPKKVQCKQLNTQQFKELIKTIVDSPFTQIEFNKTATNIFRESVKNIGNYSLNVIDRLLFLLETRIQSVSSTIALTNDDGVDVTMDLNVIKQNILQKLKQTPAIFQPLVISEENFKLTVEIPTLATEEQLNNELYSKLDLESIKQDSEEVRKFIGDSFIYEIAKYLKSVQLQNNYILDCSTVSFEERVSLIESLPASLTQKVIKYIETQKSAIDECMISQGFYVGVDNTLFTLT